MNFLAHLYLSGSDHEIMVGNILADRMKGQKVSEFSEGIQKGIRLHHAIDEYTDKHPVVKKSKERLRPLYRHYSPVITDIFYDHFLAADWDRYSDVPLHEFASESYLVLKQHKKLFKGGFRMALAYMRFRNLLVSYSSMKGVRFALERMSERALNSGDLVSAVAELQKNYELYKKEFSLFFPELIDYVRKYDP
jgi:acyl carrier protein phosphodiesterase